MNFDLYICLPAFFGLPPRRAHQLPATTLLPTLWSLERKCSECASLSLSHRELFSSVFFIHTHTHTKQCHFLLLPQLLAHSANLSFLLFFLLLPRLHFGIFESAHLNRFQSSTFFKLFSLAASAALPLLLSSSPKLIWLVEF